MTENLAPIASTVSGMPSPVLWGNEATVQERLGHGLSTLSLTRRQYLFSYPFPPSEVVEFFRLYYGPTNRAFASAYYFHGDDDFQKEAAARRRGGLLQLGPGSGRS